MTLDAKQKKYLIIGGAVILGVYLVSKWLHSMPKPENTDLPTLPTLDKEKVLKKGFSFFPFKNNKLLQCSKSSVFIFD